MVSDTEASILRFVLARTVRGGRKKEVRQDLWSRSATMSSVTDGVKTISGKSVNKLIVHSGPLLLSVVLEETKQPMVFQIKAPSEHVGPSPHSKDRVTISNRESNTSYVS